MSAPIMQKGPPRGRPSASIIRRGPGWPASRSMPALVPAVLRMVPAPAVALVVFPAPARARARVQRCHVGHARRRDVFAATAVAIAGGGRDDATGHGSQRGAGDDECKTVLHDASFF